MKGDALGLASLASCPYDTKLVSLGPPDGHLPSINEQNTLSSAAASRAQHVTAASQGFPRRRSEHTQRGVALNQVRT